jgi:hypothetical protein
VFSVPLFIVNSRNDIRERQRLSRRERRLVVVRFQEHVRLIRFVLNDLTQFSADYE